MEERRLLRLGVEAIEKGALGSLSIKVTNFTNFYIYIYIYIAVYIYIVT